MRKQYPLVDAASEFDAVILANGDYPTHAVPTAILAHTPTLVCCDGAARQALDHELTPTWVIGDGDSLPADCRDLLADRLHVIAEQDYNDLTKATRFLLTHRASQRIAYLGTTGRRDDHTLGNIALMAYYVRQFGICPTLVTDYGYFVAARGNQCFATRPGQQVSLFRLSGQEMESEGLKWQAYPFDMLWQGTLNEALGSEVSIRSDGEYLVYRTH
jgi:thiamine pyrophosphokinase